MSIHPFYHHCQAVRPSVRATVFPRNDSCTLATNICFLPKRQKLPRASATVWAISSEPAIPDGSKAAFQQGFCWDPVDHPSLFETLWINGRNRLLWEFHPLSCKRVDGQREHLQGEHILHSCGCPARLFFFF